MKGYYSKKLQQTSTRYLELQENIQFYFKHSLVKEDKQKSYLENHTFINLKGKEKLQLNYDFEKKYKEYSKVTEQRALTIQELARREEMCSVFITLTLPSKYHPFKSVQTKTGRLYVKENEEFEFSSIQEAISNGYQYLNHIYKTFYKRVKNYVKNDLYYIKVIENHVTMVPHLHLVLYFPFEHLDSVRGLYKRVVEHFQLSRVDLEEVNFRDDINYASSYLLKYIVKDLNNASDVFKARVLDGWKRHHKIRVLTTSQLSLNLMSYKKIYNSLSFMSENRINFENDDKIKTEKEKIDEEVAKLGLPLYLFFLDNFSSIQTILQGNARKIIRQGDTNALFTVNTVFKKCKDNYALKELVVYYKKEKIYTKPLFLKIKKL